MKSKTSPHLVQRGYSRDRQNDRGAAEKAFLVYIVCVMVY